MTPPPTPPPQRGLSPDEQREVREMILTFVPSIAIAFVLRWALVTNAGWAPRRAMLVGIGVGIVLSVLVQRSLRRPGRP